MWQALLVVAVAGSTGIVAKRFFFNPFSPLSKNGRYQDIDESQESVTPPVGIGCLHSPCGKTDGVFRLSSGKTAGSLYKNRSGVASSFRLRGLKHKKKKKGFRGHEIDKGSGNGGGDVWCKKKTSDCSNMPRTGEKNNAAAASPSKCVSCSTDQDSSLFRWGLGVGVMYMILVGKNEIRKLNAAMEETAKVVHELKDELSRRKSLHNLQVPSSDYGLDANSMKTSGKCGRIDLNNSWVGSRGHHDVKPPSFPTSDDVEYASSVLTEEPEPEHEPEPQPEVLELDRLQMELESELEKLNLTEPDEPVEGFSGLMGGSEPYQCGGVLASELDKKLSRLLIEQQEGQIKELEAELQTVQSKFQHKEAELQALKDCVRRLTDFSLSTSLDDEPDTNRDQDLPSSCARPMEPSSHVQER